MNTISSVGQKWATDGLTNYNSRMAQANAQAAASVIPETAIMTKDGAQVADTIVQNIAQVKESVRQMQQISDTIIGRKLQFNVNEKLGRVVVEIVDPQTDKVIKEIPSEDIQKMQIRIRETIGLLFDELV